MKTRKMNKTARTWLAAMAVVVATDGLMPAKAAAQEAQSNCVRYSTSTAGGHADFVFGISMDYGRSGQDEEGMRIAGVSHGGAAEEAGLRAGDVVTAVAGQDLTATLSADRERRFRSDRSLAAQRFSQVLRDLEIEEGDAFEFEVLRDGEAMTLEIVPEMRPCITFDVVRVREEFEEALERARESAERARRRMEDPDFQEAIERTRNAAERIRVRMDDPGFAARFWVTGRSIAGLELVDVNPDLGAYFGAETGVLVVEAEEDSWTGLRGGDVVTHVDGRSVENVAKLRRIMRSYEDGEEVRFRIRRDGEETTVAAHMK